MSKKLFLKGAFVSYMRQLITLITGIISLPLLFNYLEPPNAYYDFDRIYSAEQWQKKQRWLTDYLHEYQPDIIGFQEVFSSESLKELVTSEGYGYFEVVDQPEVIDDFIYKRPVVAIASRYPIVGIKAVEQRTRPVFKCSHCKSPMVILGFRRNTWKPG